MGGGRVLRAVGARMGAMFGPPSSSSSVSGMVPRVVSVATAASSPSACPPPASISAASEETGLGRKQQQQMIPSFLCDGDAWESVVEEDGFCFTDRYVFGPVPTEREVVEAVSAIKQVFVPVTFPQVFEDESAISDMQTVHEPLESSGVMHGVTTIEAQSDWKEPTQQICNTRSVQSQKVLDAFRSLQTNPSVQRMVTSLSSDKAVWDAVMKNDAVKELRDSFYSDESNQENDVHKNDNCSNRSSTLWSFLENTKVKVMELFGNIGKIIGDLFHPQEEGKEMDGFMDAVRSSFMLSVLVVIVVVMFRAYKA